MPIPQHAEARVVARDVTRVQYEDDGSCTDGWADGMGLIEDAEQASTDGNEMETAGAFWFDYWSAYRSFWVSHYLAGASGCFLVVILLVGSTDLEFYPSICSWKQPAPPAGITGHVHPKSIVIHVSRAMPRTHFFLFFIFSLITFSSSFFPRPDPPPLPRLGMRPQIACGCYPRFGIHRTRPCLQPTLVCCMWVGRSRFLLGENFLENGLHPKKAVRRLCFSLQAESFDKHSIEQYQESVLGDVTTAKIPPLVVNGRAFSVVPCK